MRAELDRSPGLVGIKSAIDEFAASARMREMRRGRAGPRQRHATHDLHRQPGTGKTTVARIIAEVLDATGSMPGAHMVEADRSMLVGEWLGSSALKTRKVAEAALGGVLFIDEAYSLAGQSADGSRADRFAQEALATLLKIMEDERDALVVILAGYPAEMDELLKVNPGLSSRVGMTIDFPDYDDDALVDIFTLLCEKADYTVAPDAELPLRLALPRRALPSAFGNARWAQQHGSLGGAHAVRVSAMSDPDVEELRTLRMADVRSGWRGLRGEGCPYVCQAAAGVVAW